MREENPPINVDRERAWQTLCEYTKGESLRRHALAVEAAMRAAAQRYGGEEADPNEWGIVGLLHDFDYEMYPEATDHPYKGAEILRNQGYPERMIEAIMGHAPYTGTPRETQMARSLFAVDELCGFLVACALVRPDRSLQNLEPSSVKKKLKDKAFARTVNRDDVRLGIDELGVETDEHIRFVIETLRPIERDLGLAGGEKKANMTSS
jgi:putative nucleotidyltransferase with HDIG domain